MNNKIKKLVCLTLLAPSYSFVNNVNIRTLTVISAKKVGKEQYFEEKYFPQNENQIVYAKKLADDKTDLVIGVGPAGTGKSLFPCQEAIKQYIYNNKKIVITRPMQTVDEDLGYLPGGINDKMDPWVRPLLEIFQEYLSVSEVEILIKNKRIEIVPLAFMRGRTFKNSIIIGDEMQNTTPEQMFMLLTRIGKGSKLCITGDLKQCDSSNNGLEDLIKRLHNHYVINKKGNITNDGIQIVEFTRSDILRHKFVSKIMGVYDKD